MPSHVSSDDAAGSSFFSRELTAAGGQSGSTGAAQGGQRPPLGSKRQYIDPPAAKEQVFRREIAADQRQAASVFRVFWSKMHAEGVEPEAFDALAGRGVQFCGWTQIAGMQTRLMRQMRAQRFTAYMSGIQGCGLRWVCPVCTMKKAETDRASVNDGLAGARSLGLFPVMLTLTTRHTKKDSALGLLSAILAAEQGLKGVKAWRRLPFEGFARVLEWTYGRHGHHPHFHVIILMRAESEAAAVDAVKAIQPAYMRQLTAAGRDGMTPAAWEHSFDVRGAATAENYITKWGAAEELTGTQKKDDSAGFTPWQLLRLSRTAPAVGKRSADQERQRFAAIWWEIIQATKGKVQLYRSEGFKRIAKEYRENQPIEAPMPDPEEVVALGQRQRGEDASPLWNLARHRTLVLREVAENHKDLDDAQRAVWAAIIDAPTDQEIFENNEDDFGPVIENDEPRLIHTPQIDASPASSFVDHQGGQDSRRSKI